MAQLANLQLDKTLYRIQTTEGDSVISGDALRFLQSVSGTETASESLVSGEIDGNLILLGAIQSKNFATGSTGWQLTGTSGEINFAVTVGAGSTVGGFTIGATDLTATAGGNTTILSSGATAFSAGPTGSPTATITQAGVLTATGAVIDGTSTIGGRIASTLASAIDATGQLITSNLNTSAKTILGEFSFGVSGALQIGEYVNGVSGDVKISPAGIVARDSTGANSFTLDGTTGSGTFAGALVAATGTLGTITSATITAGSFQTASGTGQRIIIDGSDNTLKFYNSTNQLLLDLGNDVVYTNRIFRTGTSTIALRVADLDADDINTVSLMELEVRGTSSTGPSLSADHNGLGHSAHFFTTNNASRTNATVRIDSQTTGASAHLLLTPISSAPGTPTEGEIYTNTNNFPYYYDGTAQRAFVLNGPDQTVGGIFTYSSFPVTPSSDPSSDYEVANKQYVDNSGALISTVVTDVTVANTVTETNLISVSIPGGTLGTNKGVRFKLFISDLGIKDIVSSGLSIAFRYGDTLVTSFTIPRPGGDQQNLRGYIEGFLLADGATNAQEGSIQGTFTKSDGYISTSSATSNELHAGGGASGAVAKDSTGALTLRITAQWGAADVGNTITMFHAVVEALK